MKEYHARYKICETHLKASVVTKSGRQQRFCQQCGKFHDIGEFDGEKRSCRARLDKHNTRRRRQREMQHMLRTTGRIDEAALRSKYGMTEEELAPKIQKLHKQMRLSNNTISSATSTGGPTTSGQSGGSAGMHVSTPTTAATTTNAHHQAALLGLPGITQADLDLLGDAFLDDVLGPAALNAAAAAAAANATAAAAAVNVNLNALLQQSTAAAGQDFMTLDAASVMDLDDMAVLEELTREFGVNPNAAALAAASSGSHHLARNGNSAASPFATAPINGASVPPALSPLAAAQQAAAFPFLSSASLPWMSSAHHNSNNNKNNSTGGANRTVTTGISGLPPYMQAAPGGTTTAAAATNAATAPIPTARLSSSSDNTAIPALEEALNLLAYDQSHVQYAVDDRLVRLSVKLFGCSPADLPSDLKNSLRDMLAAEAMEGYIRPGCVHVEANAMMTTTAEGAGESVSEGGMHAAVERFLAGSPATAAAAHTVVLQLGDKMAMVRDGKLIHVVDISGAARLMPAISAVRPLALTPPPSRHGSVTIHVWGYNLGHENDVVLARSQGRHLETEVMSVSEPMTEWDGLQKMQVKIKGPLNPGTVQVEVMRGAYATAARSLLVAPNAEIAGEIATLEATPDVGVVDTLMYELGIVIEANFGGAGAAAALANAPIPPSKAATRLLPFTIQRKWPALTRVALSAAIVDQPASEAMSAADVIAVGTTGMSLLQLAVRTQSSDMLAQLLNWGRSMGHEFKSTTPGRRGLTALHLAALVHDGGLIAALLTAACPDALAGWEGVRADDGSTPLGLATQHGTVADLERVIAQAQYMQVQMRVQQAAAAAARGGSSSSLKASESMRLSSKALSIAQNMPAEIDDVVIAKAAHKGESFVRDAATGPLLTFASPQLEAKYASWYHAGQVPVDVAFMMITILSQLAWVLRWQMGSSLILGFSMMALIVFNAFYLTMATMRPRAYIARREVMCITSLFVHKIVQLLVTGLPGVGTIYSPTYNTTVALLESSSFAQIAMLSFGAKARAAYHIPALLAMLPMSASLNGSICAAAFPGMGLLSCRASMFVFQALACCALPAAGVYFSEHRSRRIFLETAVA